MDTEYHSLKFFQLFKSNSRARGKKRATRSLFPSVGLQVVDRRATHVADTRRTARNNHLVPPSP
jgi:hypothetical protein